jgi:hypothetical protein
MNRKVWVVFNENSPKEYIAKEKSTSGLTYDKKVLRET